MSQNEKFIITKEKETADKLIAVGFKLVSEISGIWTFMNSVPNNFNFDEIDKKKYCFTNKLCL